MVSYVTCPIPSIDLSNSVLSLSLGTSKQVRVKGKICINLNNCNIPEKCEISYLFVPLSLCIKIYKVVALVMAFYKRIQSEM